MGGWIHREFQNAYPNRQTLKTKQIEPTKSAGQTALLEKPGSFQLRRRSGPTLTVFSWLSSRNSRGRNRTETERLPCLFGNRRFRIQCLDLQKNFTCHACRHLENYCA